VTNYRQDPRLAGQVVRWHTVPMLRRETVAEHSWQVARLALAICPDLPRDVLVRALMHDVGEIASGDVPFPVKANNPVLRREMDRVERSGHLAMCIPWGLPSNQPIDDAWASVLKLAEMIDMWETGAQEQVMGSQFGREIADRLVEIIRQRCLDLQPSMPEVAERAEQYVGRRQREWAL
jgi:hypothetical protein